MRIAVVAAFNRFRLFHWLLAGFFLGAYLSGDDAETLHIWLGYGLVALLVWRLLIVPLRLRGFPQLLPPKGQRSKPGLSSVGKWLTVGALSFAIASVVGLGMVDNGDVLPPCRAWGRMSRRCQRHRFHRLDGRCRGGARVLRQPGAVADRPACRLCAAVPPQVGMADAARACNGAGFDCTFGFDVDTGNDVGRDVRIGASACRRGVHPSAHRLTPGRNRRQLLVHPAGAGRPARFAAQPGQFLTLKVPAAEPALLRCYSLSQRPQADGALRITIKRVPGGRASNWLLDNLQAGDCIEALPPAGVFVPRNLDDDLLLLGAGSGITPLMAILQAALVEGSGQVRLFYASRDAASLIFAEELAEWSARYPDRLQLRIWLDAEQGVPSGPAIATKIADWSAADAFICGPQPFMDAAGAALGERVWMRRVSIWNALPPQRRRPHRAGAAAACGSRSTVAVTSWTCRAAAGGHGTGWP